MRGPLCRGSAGHLALHRFAWCRALTTHASRFTLHFFDFSTMNACTSQRRRSPRRGLCDKLCLNCKLLAVGKRWTACSSVTLVTPGHEKNNSVHARSSTPEGGRFFCAAVVPAWDRRSLTPSRPTYHPLASRVVSSPPPPGSCRQPATGHSSGTRTQWTNTEQVAHPIRHRLIMLRELSCCGI